MLHKIASVFVAVAALTLTGLSSAKAHDYHTPNVCSTTAPEVCAHIGADAAPVAANEFGFMLHFMPRGVAPTTITDVGVALFMDMHGSRHGTTPVTVTPAGNSIHYQVTKVDFMNMPGAWEIEASFTVKGVQHKLIIPIVVK